MCDDTGIGKRVKIQVWERVREGSVCKRERERERERDLDW